MKTREERAELLQTLLDRCNDSRKGYEKAANAAESASLKLHLYNISLERADFGKELAEMVKSLGGDPSKGGTIAGALHRNWLDLKALLSNNTEENILDEALNGEQRLIEDYVDTVQKGEFDKEIERKLSRQLGNVQARVERIESLMEKVS